MRKKKKGNKVGRPTKITKEILEKLDNAFSLGHSDEEACLVAQIDPQTLYNYCKKHPNYSSKKELLKNSPKIVARRNIVKDLNDGDVKTSKWYLERKAKDEFSNRQELKDVTEEDNEAIQILRRIIDSHDKSVRSK